MKVTIVKYLNPKGKVVEMSKDNFKGRDLPQNIIEEYEVEIKGEASNVADWLEDLKIKYATGNYILIYKGREGFVPIKWQICCEFDEYQFYDFKLIHNKHKDILEAYLENPSVEIETGMFAPMTGEIEPSKWVDLEKDFIEEYNEEFWYRLKVKDLAWYEDENMIGKLIIDELNDTNIRIFTVENFISKNSFTKDGVLKTIKGFRPATESEALSLVYKPQQKVSKEINLAESDRLKDLFLNNEAECLVENGEEFKLVYDFLDMTCDKNIQRWIPSKDKGFYDRFPLLILCSDKWDNIFKYNFFKDRKVYKPLIKYSNGVFSLIKQGGEI